jgi:hypothetical protein
MELTFTTGCYANRYTVLKEIGDCQFDKKWCDKSVWSFSVSDQPFDYYSALD